VKLIVSRAALADLARLYDFLAARNPDAARRAIDPLFRAVHCSIHPRNDIPFRCYGYVLGYRYQLRQSMRLGERR
jgi:plasmid stabilization system protein ParE